MIGKSYIIDSQVDCTHNRRLAPQIITNQSTSVRPLRKVAMYVAPPYEDMRGRSRPSVCGSTFHFQDIIPQKNTEEERCEGSRRAIHRTFAVSEREILRIKTTRTLSWT
ncbi:hypothetical protein P5V15_003170 [Pogonomyrmex californicus]